ncbi:type II toxin-antitoxin system VapB family antitoxin [Microbacterium protaetiae]|nr:type II toxin-antitoxin system VapB family antitoxin [Microbacterium protaetiae]
MQQIIEDARRQPVLDERTSEEILSYDDSGLPT